MHPATYAHDVLFTSADSNTGISIPLGIVIGLLASFVQSVGLAIQRRSHVLDAQLPESERRVEHKRPLWLVGFAVFLTSNIFGSVIQIASLPVVILAPLGAVSLLWNALFARLLFRLPLLLGTALIAGGAALIAAYGIVPETTRSLEELMALFARHAFIAWFCVESFVVAVCLFVTHIAEYSFTRSLAAMYPVEGSRIQSPTASPQCTPPLSPLTLSLDQHPSVLTTGLTEEITTAGITEHTPLLDPKSTTAHSIIHSSSSSMCLEHHDAPIPRGFSPRTPFFLALAFAAGSGTLSGLCLIFAKSGVELLVLTLGGDNQFYRWEAWVLVGGLVAFALGQLWYLNRGLRFAGPAVVCPSAFCFYNVSSIINGVIYYDQLALLPGGHIALVVLGMVLLLAGVWAVSMQAGADVRAWEEESHKVEECNPEEEGLLDIEANREGEECGEGIAAVPHYTLDQKSRSKSRSGAPPMEHQPSDNALRSNSGSASMYTLHTLPADSPAHFPPLSRSQSHSHSQSHPHSHSHSQSFQVHPSHSHITTPPPLNDPYLLSPTTSTSPSSRRRSAYGDTVRTKRLSLQNVGLSPPLRGGLAIGLSPASPGFLIVPRSRIVTDSGNGLSNVVDAAVSARKARSVSENGSRWWEISRGEDGDGEDNGQAERAQNEGTAGRQSGASLRWNWIRQVLAGRKGLSKRREQ